MLWIIRRSFILKLSSIQNHSPLLINLVQIQRCRLGYRHESYQTCDKRGISTEQEQLLFADKVEEDGCEECSEFSGGGRDAVAHCSGFGRKDFCGYQERRAVWSTLDSRSEVDDGFRWL